ncbi:iron-sulfur cluster repair protein YtfE [Thiomonas delicata]|uniref:Iron-sulfur cluster repair protein YtfE n=1 Tax=Thiomonas delicata TaxID=364030 RepID=A0A238D8F1_THIDL|nr:iron-sulfur cluster repair protein YtfE [Thiomonas delicata]SBP89442.1 Iron-sulfur cluster repair protein YtfE [Thiomonas delicata]
MPNPDRQASPSLPLATRPLGHLARDLPGATAVFRRHRLDFCCGGETTLEAAARALQLDIAEIERELLALDVQAPAETPHDPNTLIDLIVSRFHDVHRRELPELITLAAKVERVHQSHPDVPAGLAALLQKMQDELQAHMQKEEQILFPMMRRNPGGFLAPPIARMREEHDDHGLMLRRVQDLTHDLRLPAEACNTWRALYAGLDKFVADFMQHVHTENNILFPQFEGRG